ncbi:MAG: PhnA domain-containing protein [Janthinobacterium lividum]
MLLKEVDLEEVDCKVDGMSVVLKTCFLKKRSALILILLYS